ncbi:putative metallo-beta-lactamase [Gottschalkia acidurici 9a]|uniref:Metallo-beta-lactamase n=1 Tax=Gottschalkia acidurici (strain ATCC 7906 / DSM 604 / BCRC 14475 / CIP 104303 / KCTC 5404 / NCIMB 10678 / 9a) TaxID=1128398 RepID=K0B2E0_GOTA9|nr:MBL fold metallo-hydrolase [Gottschalkia acidurici]AFS79664.1 putative metallo-beta-lactamase [Gottschalkia acidurici 9a]
MLNKLTERVYYLPYQDEGCQPALGLIIGDKYSLVVDAGNSMGHAKEFLEEISKLDIPPLKYLAITHYHWDHVAGISTMNLTTVLNEKNYKNIEDIKTLIENDKKISVKELGRVKHSTATKLRKQVSEGLSISNGDIIFNGKVEIDLGGIKCIVENIGGDHSEDSNLIYIENEKVMFLGDSIYRDLNRRHKCYHMEKLVPLIEKINRYDTEYYLTAHRPVYTKKSMKELFDMMIDIGNLVGNKTDLEELTKSYSEKVNREVTEEEVFYIESFINRNKN